MRTGPKIKRPPRPVDVTLTPRCEMGRDTGTNKSLLVDSSWKRNRRDVLCASFSRRRRFNNLTRRNTPGRRVKPITYPESVQNPLFNPFQGKDLSCGIPGVSRSRALPRAMLLNAFGLEIYVCLRDQAGMQRQLEWTNAKPSEGGSLMATGCTQRWCVVLCRRSGVDTLPK